MTPHCVTFDLSEQHRSHTGTPLRRWKEGQVPTGAIKQTRNMQMRGRTARQLTSGESPTCCLLQLPPARPPRSEALTFATRTTRPTPVQQRLHVVHVLLVRRPEIPREGARLLLAPALCVDLPVEVSSTAPQTVEYVLIMSPSQPPHLAHSGARSRVGIGQVPSLPLTN